MLYERWKAGRRRVRGTRDGFLIRVCCCWCVIWWWCFVLKGWVNFNWKMGIGVRDDWWFVMRCWSARDWARALEARRARENWRLDWWGELNIVNMVCIIWFGFCVCWGWLWIMCFWCRFWCCLWRRCRESVDCRRRRARCWIF